MTDVIIGRIKGEVLFVRDADDDGVLDEGERIGVRGTGDRFDEGRVAETLVRAGISGAPTGARLQRIGTYIDFINEADRLLQEGDSVAAHHQLEQAETFAAENGISIDASRLADLRWRAVDTAFERSDLGADDLDTMDLKILRLDDEPGGRNRSADLILDYLTTRASIHNYESSSGPGREHRLRELRGEARDLAAEIALRAHRVRTVLDLGGRTTVAEQVSTGGTVFHIGDRVRYRDPESGDTFGAPFVITGFEIHASGVIARGAEPPTPTSSRDPRSADIVYLEILPPEVSSTERAPLVARRGEDSWTGWFSELSGAARRWISTLL